LTCPVNPSKTVRVPLRGCAAIRFAIYDRRMARYFKVFINDTEAGAAAVIASVRYGITPLIFYGGFVACVPFIETLFIVSVLSSPVITCIIHHFGGE